MTVCLNGHQFGWEFIIAYDSVSILCMDFLCAQRLLVDVANRQLIDYVSFDTVLVKMLATGIVFRFLP